MPALGSHQPSPSPITVSSIEPRSPCQVIEQEPLFGMSCVRLPRHRTMQHAELPVFSIGSSPPRDQPPFLSSSAGRSRRDPVPFRILQPGFQYLSQELICDGCPPSPLWPPYQARM